MTGRGRCLRRVRYHDKGVQGPAGRPSPLARYAVPILVRQSGSRLTDVLWEAALHRAHLAGLCEALGIPHIPYQWQVC